MCSCDAKCKKNCGCACHGHVERESARMYAVGQLAGLDEAAHALLERATASFRAGCDEEAKMLRALSREMSERARKAHPGVPALD